MTCGDNDHKQKHLNVTTSVHDQKSQMKNTKQDQSKHGPLKKEVESGGFI